MAYSELIKSFGRIRGYMKEFYIYGFKKRNEYTRRSSRSYDNERRRIESYFGGHMGYLRSKEGKNVFISVDTRSTHKNPIFKALKAKSFTDGDITLHFILFDILYSPEISLPISEITRIIDEEYMQCFKKPLTFDESTIRKKLREYADMGLVLAEKCGKQTLYRRAEDIVLSEDMRYAAEFFSEVSGCGAAGSYILDRYPDKEPVFSFKHHYINGALDSEILCELFRAIRSKCSARIGFEPRGGNPADTADIVPLKIYSGAQNGRQYLFAYHIRRRRIFSYRLDFINSVTVGMPSDIFDEQLEKISEIRKHMWGVSIGRSAQTEHVEFTVHIGENEEYIYKRMVREKRCGEVERIDEHTCRFSADIYDTSEMIPWIRTFICRIESLNFSNRTAENRLRQDIEEMYRLYGIGDEE
ncbi:MAG: WYL domain-containing protein [Oscillospiraceae bacterium]